MTTATKLNFHNLKGTNFNHDLPRCCALVGAHNSGKTTVLDAIQLAWTGKHIRHAAGRNPLLDLISYGKSVTDISLTWPERAGYNFQLRSSKGKQVVNHFGPEDENTVKWGLPSLSAAALGIHELNWHGRVTLYERWAADLEMPSIVESEADEELVASILEDCDPQALTAADLAQLIAKSTGLKSGLTRKKNARVKQLDSQRRHIAGAADLAKLQWLLLRAKAMQSIEDHKLWQARLEAERGCFSPGQSPSLADIVESVAAGGSSLTVKPELLVALGRVLETREAASASQERYPDLIAEYDGSSVRELESRIAKLQLLPESTLDDRQVRDWLTEHARLDELAKKAKAALYGYANHEVKKRAEQDTSAAMPPGTGRIGLVLTDTACRWIFVDTRGQYHALTNCGGAARGFARIAIAAALSLPAHRRILMLDDEEFAGATSAIASKTFMQAAADMSGYFDHVIVTRPEDRVEEIPSGYEIIKFGTTKDEIYAVY